MGPPGPRRPLAFVHPCPMGVTPLIVCQKIMSIGLSYFKLLKIKQATLYDPRVTTANRRDAKDSNVRGAWILKFRVRYSPRITTKDPQPLRAQSASEMYTVQFNKG